MIEKENTAQIRTLVMSILDLHQEPNQRTQHMVRMLAELSSEVIVITKARSFDRSLAGLLRDTLQFKLKTSREANTVTLSVHPFLNYAQALASGWMGGNVNHPPGLLKRMVGCTLSFAGILRDMFLIPTFLLVALLRTRQHFNLCFVDGPWTAAAGYCLRILGRVDTLVYDDIDYVAGGQTLKIRAVYVAALERAMIRRADIVVSAGWRLGAHRELSCGKHVRVIPNGVDPKRFSEAINKRPHPPTLVYMGHLAHYCGVDLAVRSLPEIRSVCPNARLLIIGEGDRPYIDGLHELAVALQMQDQVIFQGKVPYEGLAALLAECDLGLANSRPTLLRNFAFPLKVIEYMAAGLPVICTEDSEAAEILIRYQAGLSIPFEQQALVKACIQLLTVDDEYEKAQSIALKTAQVFTWQASTNAMKRLVREEMHHRQPNIFHVEAEIE